MKALMFPFSLALAFGACIVIPIAALALWWIRPEVIRE